MSNAAPRQPLILAASYNRYSLPLRQAVTTGDTTLLREGLVLEILLGSDAGQEKGQGRAEISPLPGIFFNV